MVNLEEIKAAVPELSPEERDELRALLEEFDDGGIILSPELNAELEHRVQEIRDGKAKLVSHEDVMNEARERIRRSVSR
jgi:putative addiction module component (TIGR02574 family)